MKKRLTALLISLCLFLCIINTGTVAVSAKTTVVKNTIHDEVPGVSYKVIHNAAMYKTFTPGKSQSALCDGSTDYGYCKLDEPERKAYSLFKKAAQAIAVNRYLNISDLNLTLDEAYDAFCYFYYDNPQYFWLDSACMIVSDTNSGVALGIVISSLYKTSGGQADNVAINILQKKIDKAFDVYYSVSKNAASDYDKELILHDMIVNNTTYDKWFQGLIEDSSIVGPLVNHVARSGGYSRALQYLLNRSGINCLYVIGKAKNYGRTWNIAQIDGNYYQIDAAWDDPIGNVETVSHQYFNITDKDMLANHVIDNKTEKYMLPVCTADTDNYYKRSGAFYDSTDNFVNKTESLIASDINNGSYDVEVKSSNAAVYKNILKLLIINGKATNLFAQIVKQSNKRIDKQYSDTCLCGFSENPDLNILTLHFMRGDNTIDKTDISQKISYAKHYYCNESIFTTESYMSFSCALSKAESVNSSDSVTQDDADTAADNLQTAINNLEYQNNVAS